LENNTVALTVTPNAGYELDSMTYAPASGTAVVITPDANGVYSFTMPAEAVTVTAIYEDIPAITYAITSDGAAGSNAETYCQNHENCVFVAEE